MRFGLALALICWACAAVASDRATLEAMIERAGANETAIKRHAVEIRDCMMTTYVWKPYKTHGFQLWSSWQVDLRGLGAAEMNTRTGERFIVRKSFVADGQPPVDPMVIMLFRMDTGWRARHEIPMSRMPERPYERSLRAGVEDYVYQQKTAFRIQMDGPDVIAKAKAFTDGLIRYRADYCQLIG